jgi:hypothetical protein
MADETASHDFTRLLVVIVNYRTSRLAINCLKSLENEVRSLPGTRVVVVDNASGDDSVEVLTSAIQSNNWQDWATLLPSEHNGGYAYGNNLAIRPALQSDHPPEYFLLLNPDTQIYPNALNALVDFMDQHPEVGIGGSSFEEADGEDWPITFRFPTVLSELDSGLRLGIVSKLLSNWTILRRMTKEPALVDWLPGASMIIRKDVFNTIGLMDEKYFLYYEETDFCLQAKRAGWPCWYIPQSRVMHIAGQSTGVTVRNQQPKRLPQYWFDSRRRFFIKNYGLLYTALVDSVWIASFSFWRLRRLIQRKPDLDPPQMLGDYIRNSVFLKGGLPTEN